MKKYVFSFLMFLILLGQATLHAKPERILIKARTENVKERTATTKTKNVYLKDIEDPAAQKAIRELYSHLGLKTKK